MARKVPYSLHDYGNTSSASVPVTLVTQLRGVLTAGKGLKLLLSGFGVGLSWGSAYLETENIVCLLPVEFLNEPNNPIFGSSTRYITAPKPCASFVRALTPLLQGWEQLPDSFG